MEKYDAVIVLGSQPDIVTWKFPEQVYLCLDKARLLLENGQTDLIVTSGKRSTSLDNRGIKQPFRECDAMADYLQAQGTTESKILKEGSSKDTISNLYYLKTDILIPKGLRKIIFVVADFRIPRLQFLCQRILGDEYDCSFEPIASEPSSSYNEPHTFKIQKDFLEPMKDGNHTWLADKFYTASMYKYWAKHDRKKYASQQS